ncbi:MAG: glutathione S-transferase C-terminal domain-containing protein, partial [Burkholderiaceae bacterium]|nr:glutathione S-transferase C-terminal domain-containing protein [Burkholderiaceae bacterium]
TRHWLIRCIGIHEAINSLSFATLMRQREHTAFSAAEIEARQNQIPNPQVRAKRRDLSQNATGSVYVQGALHVLRRVFEDMAAALARDAWLAGPGFGLADAALLPYIDRLERLGMAGLWQTDFPAVGAWLAAVQQRPSYDLAVTAFIAAPEADAVRNICAAHWPAIAALWPA